MINHHLKRLQKIPGKNLLLACLLLAGILIIMYGYYQSSKIALYSGLIVTLGGVLTGIMSLLIRPVHR